MITTLFRTDDGQTFENIADAVKHDKKLEALEDKDYTVFIEVNTTYKLSGVDYEGVLDIENILIHDNGELFDEQDRFFPKDDFEIVEYEVVHAFASAEGEDDTIQLNIG